jgi:hypothetical protein
MFFQLLPLDAHCIDIALGSVADGDSIDVYIGSGSIRLAEQKPLPLTHLGRRAAQSIRLCCGWAYSPRGFPPRSFSILSTNF